MMLASIAGTLLEGSALHIHPRVGLSARLFVSRVLDSVLPTLAQCLHIFRRFHMRCHGLPSAESVGALGYVPPADVSMALFTGGEE